MERTDLIYTTMASSVGPLLLVATEKGLVRVSFAGLDFEQALEQVEDKFSLRARSYNMGFVQIEDELSSYLTGERDHFTFALDYALSKDGFTAEVHRYLETIPYGETVSYKQVAEAIGRPGAVRAVGTACGANPLPLVVPCHRVIGADGSVGGYAGDLSFKQQLLRLEGALDPLEDFDLALAESA